MSGAQTCNGAASVALCHLLWQLDDESPALPLLLLLPRAALEGVITFSLTAVPQVQLLKLQLLLLLHVLLLLLCK